MTPFRFGLLVLICVAWGLHFTVIKVTIGEIPVLFYVALRMTAVMVLLFPLLKWHDGQMGRIFLAGIGFGALNYAFTFSGVHLTTASLGAVLIETYMPIVTIMSVVFLGEKIGWRRILGLVLAFCGVVMIVSGDTDEMGARNLPLGAALIICGAACEATGAITVKKIQGVSPLQMLAWFGVVGTIVTSVLSLIFETGQWASLSGDARWPIVGALAYSVLACSIFGHASYYWLLQRDDISQVAGATMMTTLFAVGFGVWLLGDPLTARFLIGGGITMVGVAIIVLRTKSKTMRTQNISLEPEGTDVD